MLKKSLIALFLGVIFLGFTAHADFTVTFKNKAFDVQPGQEGIVRTTSGIHPYNSQDLTLAFPKKGVNVYGNYDGPLENIKIQANPTRQDSEPNYCHINIDGRESASFSAGPSLERVIAVMEPSGHCVISAVPKSAVRRGQF